MKKEINIELTEQELLDNFIVNSNTPYSMLKIADKALGEVSWHDNMPKSLKLEYISMMNKHIKEFMKDIDRNDNLSVGK